MKQAIFLSTICFLLALPLISPSYLNGASQPDLIIYLINLSQHTPCINEPIDFQVTVKNIGTRRSNPSVVGVRVGGSTAVTKLNCEPIDPGKVRSVYLKNIKLSIPRNYRVTAYADYRKQVVESNEQNNTKYKNFRVIRGCPELTINSIYVNPKNPAVNQTIDAYVKVRNSGTCIAGASKVALRIGGSSKLLQFPVPKLKAGQIHLVRTSFTLDKAGNYRITAYPDYLKQVTECKEGDYRFHSFKVGPAGSGTGYLGDLIVSIINISPSKPKVNDFIKFQITVKNIGAAQVPASVIGAQVGGDPAITFYIAAIKPGKTWTVYLPKKISKSGNYRIMAWADFRKMVGETNENNNTKFKYFWVKK